MSVSLNERTCPVCGGQYVLSVNTDYAKCENCGKTEKTDTDTFSHIRRIYTEAEQKIHLNSAEGYTEAIELLQSIPFVSETEERIRFCEKRLTELKDTKTRQDESKEKTDKRNARIGIYILIVILLTVVLIVAGLVYVIYHFRAGDLSPVSTGIFIAVIIALFIMLVIGKIKS